MMTEKSLPQPSSPQVKGRALTPYVVIWSGLAAVSVIYLGLLVSQPTVVAGYLGATETASEEIDPAQVAATQAVAEVQSLRKSIDQVRNELTQLRSDVSKQAASAQGIEQRMATLEAEPAEPRLAKDLSAKDKAAQKAAKAAEAAPPAARTKEENKKTAARDDKKKLETGSVAPPSAGAITFGPPTVTTTIAVPPSETAPQIGRQVGVQIARGPSVDSLRLSWTLLNERHGSAIGAFEPRITTDVSGPNQTYDLVIGPIANVDEARKLCHELALKATPCQVTRFTGDAL